MFYTEAHTYEKYMPAAYGMCALGILSAVLFVVILIWLTVVAGRSNLDEQLHLNWFDGWKTEPAAFIVIVLWAVPMVVLAIGNNDIRMVEADLSYYEASLIYRNLLRAVVINGFAAVYT
ncbi:MAG: sensor histidine kinase, partial [Lachnospiraceae bacterium]|nr:sensor histidine kinase [Lachnospiraceae bacterium]